jgi:serine/threonine-protein kinase
MNISSGSPTERAAAAQPKGTPEGAASSGDFVPGTVLAGRYRIVARIGRGGMGEVYRADDLRLGQAVALKFLPQAVSRDPASLARADHEVSITRKIAHPNVCRVFDIAESGRGPFITMEFIDGEDLASLLRRIGRLPPDKGLQIAHQLCAGLAAAHELGVIHRDLKPSNIMLDGRGKVRITDFGLAAVAHDVSAQDAYAGTPDYMAPEQLAGATITFGSDVYALGLVLYEVFTGVPAFGSSGAPLGQRPQKTPVRPSSVVKGLDPTIERVILRCLEQNPQARPASAIAVSAALPGGDRLRAGIAAGETPTPETVAAAGAPVFVSSARAFALLALVLIGMAGAVVLSGYGTAIGLSPAEKTPDFLVERAHAIIARFGYHEAARDDASWFAMDRNYFSGAARRANQLVGGPVKFSYRQSSRPMVPLDYFGLVSEDDPRPVPGDFLVVLDGSGHLLEFVAQPATAGKASAAPNWNMMFDEAGIAQDRLSEKDLDWVPPVPHEFRRSWQAVDSGLTYDVTAASFNGQPVYFRIAPAGSKPGVVRATRSQRLGGLSFLSVVAVLAIGGIYLARRNLRRGRGDRKGALRIAGFIFASGFLTWLFSAHHVAGRDEYQMFIPGCGQALYVAAFMWILYLALEPYVRRRWPEMLISWARVLSGDLRDTRVGRDILVGAAAGSFLAAVHLFVTALPAWANIANIAPAISAGWSLRGAIAFGSAIAWQALRAVQDALACIGLLLLATVVMRNFRVALVFTIVTLSLVVVPADNLAIAVPAALVASVTVFFLLFRFGLLSIVMTLFFFYLLKRTPLTFDFSSWYAGRSLFALGLLAAIAIFGFVAVLGGRPIFNPEPEEP